MVELNYITTKSAAERWNISQRRVLTLCAEDRIEGLARVENIWLIPKDAKKPIDARTLRFATESSVSVKPFVKWAGGKGQLLPIMRKSYPDGLGTTVKKYAEPLVGGGAVLFDILSSYKLDAVYINDSNAELMNAFRVIRDSVNELVERLTQMENEYKERPADKQQEYYYDKRGRFNSLIASGESKKGVESAALFIFLNKTCFNGLYRVNRKGEFNVPIGSYKNPLICDEDNLRRISKALKPVIINCGDYREAADFIDGETFVYLDPPYRPLNATSGFTSYTETGFGDEEQIELAKFISDMDKRGAKVVLSNSDPKNVNGEDNFFDALYKDRQIQRVTASRAINSVGGGRGRISELLISNF